MGLTSEDADQCEAIQWTGKCGRTGHGLSFLQQFPRSPDNVYNENAYISTMLFCKLYGMRQVYHQLGGVKRGERIPTVAEVAKIYKSTRTQNAYSVSVQAIIQILQTANCLKVVNTEALNVIMEDERLCVGMERIHLQIYSEFETTPEIDYQMYKNVIAFRSLRVMPIILSIMNTSGPDDTLNCLRYVCKGKD